MSRRGSAPLPSLVSVRNDAVSLREAIIIFPYVSRK